MAETDAAGTEPAGRSAGLSVSVTSTDGVRLVTLAGEIDHHTRESLRRGLGMPELPDTRVVVDLERVTFMDSSGINVFVAAHRLLGDAGGWLRLAAAQDSVLRTLRIVGVDSVIDCHPSVRQALGG